MQRDKVLSRNIKNEGWGRDNRKDGDDGEEKKEC